MSQQDKDEKIALQQMVIDSLTTRLKDQEQSNQELQATMADLRSLVANLQETINEFKRQCFGCHRSGKASYITASNGNDYIVRCKRRKYDEAVSCGQCNYR